VARIRTVKPEFFRHEKLQDLEVAHPDLRPMLVFEGLWLQCDKQGIFLWRPRTLALDILPFVWAATGKHLGASIELLWESGMISRFLDGEDEYGFVPTFIEHQRIGGRELQGEAKYPPLSEMREKKRDGSITEASQPKRGSIPEVTGTLFGSDGEATGKHPEARERNKERSIGRHGDSGSTGEVPADRKHIPPAKADVRAYWLEAKLMGDPETFFDHFTSNGWKVGGKTPMKDWEASARNWSRNDRTFNGNKPARDPASVIFEQLEAKKKARAGAKAEAKQEGTT
jgi:hypothetical protein